ncbi:MAG: tetratricopeptide repeat protein [Nitrospirota bacterium]
MILTILLFLPLVSFSSELFYTIQSGSFSDIKDAHRHFDSIMERLHAKDLSHLRIEKVGEFYSVRIGMFEDYDTAEKLLKTNESQLYEAMILKAYVKDERIVALHETAVLTESGKVDKDFRPDPLLKRTELRIAEDPGIETMGGELLSSIKNVENNHGYDVETVDYGKHRKAAELFQKAVEINPDSAEAHYNLGVAYGNLGMFQKAVKAYKRAVDLDPGHEKAYCNLGIVYEEAGNYKEAIEVYEKAIRMNPGSADLYLNLGITYGRSGMNRKAVDALKISVRIAPDYADAHYNLGFAYLMLNDKNRAMSEYKTLKGLDNEFADRLLSEILGLGSLKLR